MSILFIPLMTFLFLPRVSRFHYISFRLILSSLSVPFLDLLKHCLYVYTTQDSGPWTQSLETRTGNKYCCNIKNKSTVCDPHCPKTGIF